MRRSIASILLAGGLLALGACSTPTGPLTLAERTVSRLNEMASADWLARERTA